MTCRRFTFAIVFLIATAVAPVTAKADTSVEGASALIESLGNQALDMLRRQDLSLAEREMQFGQILRDGFDLELIGRFVLGKYWRRASPEERADYIDAFSDYVIKTYARRLGGFKGESFTVVGTTITGQKNDVLVKTRIDRPSGPPVVASWRVRDVKGKEQIIDVVVEGVSMAVTQRQEFASVTQRNGLPGLMQVLRAQTETMTASGG